MTSKLILFALQIVAAATVDETGADGIDISGSYALEICESSSCSSTGDKHKIIGFLTIDVSGKLFESVPETIKRAIDRDTKRKPANYCYWFPQDVSGKKDTLVQDDAVGFGYAEMSEDAITLKFLVDSPDFRYFSQVVPQQDRLIGNWRSSYAGDGGIETRFQSAELVAVKNGPPNADTCFAAVVEEAAK